MNRTVKEYYLDAYKKELDAKVMNIEKNKIYLDKTIFYPEGGGQPGDKGFINNVEVLDTQTEKEEIAHFVKDSSPFKVGQNVSLKLDWSHRYNFMKMHTAQHLISGVLHSHFGVGTLSVHQGNEYLTIEIDKNKFSEENCYKVVDIVNRKIIESLDISFLEKEKSDAESLNLRRSIKVDGLVRLVKIDEADLIACGGLHVSNTSEIDRVMYIGFEKIRKHYRLLFKVGDDAIATCRNNLKIIKELCVLHSATVDTLVDCDKALIEKSIELERELRGIKKENANFVLTSLLKENKGKIIAEDITKYNIDFKDIDISVDKAIFLYKRENSIIKWYIYLGESYKEFDIKNIREDVLTSINGKGGGRYPSFQGKGEVDNIDKCVIDFIGYFDEKKR